MNKEEKKYTRDPVKYAIFLEKDRIAVENLRRLTLEGEERRRRSK